jgi:hypothetical protein
VRPSGKMVALAEARTLRYIIAGTRFHITQSPIIAKPAPVACANADRALYHDSTNPAGRALPTQQWTITAAAGRKRSAPPGLGIASGRGPG